jgi:inner membrane protein
MASIGHLIIGAAIAVVHDRLNHAQPRTPRQRIGAALVFPMLALLPDADVVGFRLGVAYADPWGHRGASHALMFALGLGLLLSWPLHRGLSTSLRTTAVAAVAALASHGLLDTLTDGGLGAALWWPFDDSRCFAPWRPIPVAPIGRAFVSWRGLRCIIFEMATMGPLLMAALWWSWRASRAAARSHTTTQAHL